MCSINKMDFIQTPIEYTCEEAEIFERALSLDNKHILDLGCGKAIFTEKIATEGTERTMVAMEVDKIQHSKNLERNDLPNVKFTLAGGENIPEGNETFDTVFMFKSLHHVPLESMSNTLDEIYRVLKKGGFAYISEPVFDGDFNEIVRLFHDEEVVRKAAFDAIKNSLDRSQFELQEQIFFNTPRNYKDFKEFEEKYLGVTHTKHSLSMKLLEQVQQELSKCMTDNGADFLIPMRVDLLKKF